MPQTYLFSSIKSFALVLCLISNSAAGSAAPASHGSPGGPESYLECGEPLVRVQLEGRGLSYEGLALSSGAAALLLEDSKERLGRLRSGLGELSPDEAKLADLALKFPIPLVHRTSLKNLRSILSAGALLSPREASRRGVDLMPDVYGKKANPKRELKADAASAPVPMPRLRNLLQGGLDCVYASAGPPAGEDHYGAVIIRIAPGKVMGRSLSALEGAPAFLMKNNSRYSRKEPPVPDEEILAYSRLVYSGSLARELSGLLIISGLRAGGARLDALKTRLLKAEDPERFYSLVSEGALGYSEEQIPKAVPLGDVEALLVPRGNLAEVLSWKEAEPWRGLIKGY